MRQVDDIFQGTERKYCFETVSASIIFTAIRSSYQVLGEKAIAIERIWAFAADTIQPILFILFFIVQVPFSRHTDLVSIGTDIANIKILRDFAALNVTSLSYDNTTFLCQSLQGLISIALSLDPLPILLLVSATVFVVWYTGEEKKKVLKDKILVDPNTVSARKQRLIFPNTKSHNHVICAEPSHRTLILHS